MKKLLFVLSLLLLIIFIFLYRQIAVIHLKDLINKPFVGLLPTPVPTAPPPSAIEIAADINQLRQENQRTVLKSNPLLEETARLQLAALMEKQDWKIAEASVTAKKLGYSYSQIGEAYFFLTGEKAGGVIESWQDEAGEILLSTVFRDVGIATLSGQFQGYSGTLIGAVFGRRYVPVPTPTPISISEANLWTALSEYRHNHLKNQLILNDNLCRYARQRTQELLTRLKSISAEESPLDNHAGFQRDTASGEAFAQTGFNVLAEDLAFVPSSQNAVQVIEWGWDSSAPHRESLLDNDMTHACVTGSHPIYVAILGR